MPDKIEEQSTEELQFELDLLYEDIDRSPYYSDLVHKIVRIEIELEKRSNI